MASQRTRDLSLALWDMRSGKYTVETFDLPDVCVRNEHGSFETVREICRPTRPVQLLQPVVWAHAQQIQEPALRTCVIRFNTLVKHLVPNAIVNIRELRPDQATLQVKNINATDLERALSVVNNNCYISRTDNTDPTIVTLSHGHSLQLCAMCSQVFGPSQTRSDRTVNLDLVFGQGQDVTTCDLDGVSAVCTARILLSVVIELLRYGSRTVSTEYDRQTNKCRIVGSMASTDDQPLLCVL